MGITRRYFQKMKMNEMPDREKVIKGLECCMSGQPDGLGCSRVPCPYNQFEDCEGILHRDALALLKAQEPVKPIFDYDGNDVWRCGNCHCNIFHPSRTDADENEKNYRRFCFHCGRAVKWE